MNGDGMMHSPFVLEPLMHVQLEIPMLAFWLVVKGGHVEHVLVVDKL